MGWSGLSEEASGERNFLTVSPAMTLSSKQMSGKICRSQQRVAIADRIRFLVRISDLSSVISVSIIGVTDCLCVKIFLSKKLIWKIKTKQAKNIINKIK